MESGEVAWQRLGIVTEVRREGLIEFVETKGKGSQDGKILNGQSVRLAYVHNRSYAHRSVFGKVSSN
jgi:hypothetical protein